MHGSGVVLGWVGVRLEQGTCPLIFWQLNEKDKYLGLHIVIGRCVILCS